jgi:drug/metabolite transporter (DMT)-like permease
MRKLDMRKEHAINCAGLLIVFAAIFFVLYLIFTGHIRDALDAAAAMAVYIAFNFVAFSILVVADFENRSGRAVRGYIILLTCICVYLACILVVSKWSLLLSETPAQVYANILFFAGLTIVMLFVALLAEFQ